MASKNESRSVNIYINTDQADQSFKNLSGESKKLFNEISRLAPGTDAFIRKSQEFDAVSKKVQGVRDSMKELGASAGSLGQIEASSVRLKNELTQLTPKTDAFKKKMAELQSVNTQLQSITNDIKGVGGAFGWLKTEIGKLGVLATGIVGFQFITDQFKNIISQNGALSDSLAKVRQTTGLTDVEVKKLANSLSKIDTRTAKKDLLAIAEIGGQFNVPKEQLKAFVEQMDRANVVLGTEFAGGAEQITTELALLRNNFTDIKSDHIDVDLGKIGNALVTLAQEGAATAPVVSDIAQRLAPLISTAHLTSGSILGLSATLQELAIKSERGGTGVIKLFDAMISNASAFAQVAGMSVTEFRKLTADDAMAAFTRFLDGFKKGGENIQIMNNVLANLGVDGVAAKEVLVKLSQNTDMLTQRSKLATDALTKQDKITEQFAINNSTLGAELDKLGKKFNALTSNKTLSGWLTGLVSITLSGIDAFQRHASAISNFIKVLTAAGAVWLTYKTVTALANAEYKAWILNLFTAQRLEQLEIITTTAMSAAKALLTGNIAKARQEWQLLNLAMETNPWGLAAAAIATVVSALIIFNNEATEAEQVQESLNKIQKDGRDNIAEEQTRLEQLQKILKAENTTRNEKLDAIKALRELMPDHLKGYKDEEILAGKAGTAIQLYINQLTKRAEAEAAFQQLVELNKEKNKIIAEGVGETFAQRAFRATNVSGSFEPKNKENALNIVNDKIKAIQEAYGTDLTMVTTGTKKTTTSGSNDIAGYVASSIKLVDMTVEQLGNRVTQLNTWLGQTVKGSAQYKQIAAELKQAGAIQKQIDSDTGKGGGKGANIAAERLKEFKELAEQYKLFNAADLAEHVSASAKEVAQEELKYDKLIDKEKAFLTKKGVTAKQAEDTNAKIAQLEINKKAAVNTVIAKQEQDLAEKVKNFNQSLTDKKSSLLQKQEDDINKYYDELAKNAGDDYRQRFEIEAGRQQALDNAKLADHESFLEAVAKLDDEFATTHGSKDDKERAAINKKYDTIIADLKSKFADNPDLMAEIDKLNGERSKNLSNVGKKKNQTFSEFNNDNPNALIDAEIQAAQTTADAVFKINENHRKAELDAKIKLLEDAKTAELSKVGLSEAQKAAINDKYAKLEAAAKLKAWKADQAAAEKQAVINGALAITKTYAEYGFTPAALIAIGAQAFATIAQVSVIANEDPPQFEEGGYSAVNYNKPQGYVNRPTLFANSSSGRAFSAGENYKTEYIVSSEQLKDPVVANFVGMMEANRGVRRFEYGGYSNTPGTTGTAPPVYARPQSTDTNSDRLDRIEAALEQQVKINAKPTVLSYQYFQTELAKLTKIHNDATA